ncbi:MAG: hypothetical protein PVH63_08785 [Balneolaceae bacterium]|jgi:hypothetical protein
MRILKFIGAFLGTLLLIFFLSFGFNLHALYTLFNNTKDLKEGQEWVSKTSSLKGLTEYIGAQPHRVSVVSRSITNPDTTISYSADRPRTLGALSNFFLLATYAQLVETRTIDPGELISLADINRYQLPYINSSNHENAKDWLEDKKLVNSENKARLDDLVQASITFDDLAISDFLFYKLGPKSIRQTMDLMTTQKTDEPLPFAGLYITVKPEQGDSSFKAHFNRLRNLSKQRFRDSVLATENRFLTDEHFRTSVNEHFDNDQGLGIGFMERRDILSLFPKSTARELAGLMVQLQQDSLISKAVSSRIKAFMDWPYEQENLNNDFEYYGAIYDSRLGLLNGIDYGASTYSGEPFGQAVFFDSLQVAFWFHMSSSLMNQDYQQRLIWDPALRAATREEISK